MGLLDRWKTKRTAKSLEENAEKVVKKQEEAEVVKVAKKEKEVVDKAAPEKEKKATKTAKAAKTKKEEKKTEEAPQRSVKTNEIAYKILIRPLVTEKSAIAESLNKYSFVVARDANKQEIKRAVLELYGVKPESVNMINVDGRRVRFGRSMGRRSDFKKAIVTLPAGKAITIHEGV